ALSTPTRTTKSACSNRSSAKKSSSNNQHSNSSRLAKGAGSTLKQKDSSSENVHNQSDRASSQSPSQTPSKSSHALREMLAKARKNYQDQRSQSQAVSQPEAEIPDKVTPTTISNSKSIEEQWGLQPIESIISRAQQTGKLNLSSRMLEGIPRVVYESLLPDASVFHPSNRKSNGLKNSTTTHHSSDQAIRAVPWYESVELCHINLSLNELECLDDEFGGFQALISCDLHHNNLSSLKSSFGLLINLTTLNLSSNSLQHFPLPILSLVNLKELNLSKNSLTELWTSGWKPKLKSLMAHAINPITTDSFVSEVQADSSFNSSASFANTTADSSFGIPREDPFDLFPSSPKKSSSNLQTTSDNHPLPILEKLNLSQNKFQGSKLFKTDGVDLPLNLIELDLSENPIGDRIEIWNSFSELKRLEKLDLRKCEIGDFVFDDEFGDQLCEDEGEEQQEIFKSLKSLDLSFNTIDSLERLEAFFTEHCPQRQIRYEGLPGNLVELTEQNLYDSKVDDIDTLKIAIGHNYLRDEAKRRRRLIAKACSETVEASKPESRAIPEELKDNTSNNVLKGDFTQEPEAIKISQDDELDKALQSLSIDAKPNRKKSSGPVISELKKLILNHYQPSTLTLNLKSLGMTNVPEHIDEESRDDLMLTAKGETILINCIDLSLNRLTRIPGELIGLSSNSLTYLNLSRNQIRLDRRDESRVRLIERIKLPELVELDLSSNMIGESESIFKLIYGLIDSDRCKLRIIDLSYNELIDDKGLKELVMKVKDLKEIRLNGNRIEKIEDLESLGELNNGSEGGDSNVKIDYGIEAVELRDNCIKSLPTSLGFLKNLKVLQVSGNLFRIPLRKVYETSSGGSDEKLIKWLKER
ncbi:expressed protein, partial [Phakopsora pachyrhizi]